MEEETKERLILMNLEEKLCLVELHQEGGTRGRGRGRGQEVSQGTGPDPDPDRGHDNDLITAQKTVRGNMINLTATKGTLTLFAFRLCDLIFTPILHMQSWSRRQAEADSSRLSTSLTHLDK